MKSSKQILNNTNTQNWHALSIPEVLSPLNSTCNGLTPDEVKVRQDQYGWNELTVTKKISPWLILYEQFKNVLIVILLIATVFSFFLGHRIEAVAIAVIVLFAVVLGFLQEYRAEKAIDALKKMAAPLATVIRNGKEIDIPAKDLVPGDIIVLHEGNKIPADARLFESMNLKVEEAALTGESLPVEKHIETLIDENLALGDRKNLVFAGTVVTYGRGKAIVVGTGMNTEFGKIAKMLQTVETSRTPLQKNLDKVGHILARAAFVVVALIVALGLFRGQPFIEMLIFGIALAVAVVPEALPAVVTISLALGVQRMVKRNALIRSLPAVETLGSTTIICSDKTGTLTKDEMTARKIFVAGKNLDISGIGYDPIGEFTEKGEKIGDFEPLRLLLQAAMLSCDAKLIKNDDNGWAIKGDPTEGALVVAAAKAKLEKSSLEKQFPRVNEIPFSSERKRMTTLHSTVEGSFAYSKGAPEILLDSCSKQLTFNGEELLDENKRKAILDQAQMMAKDALRVLALAYKSNATIENAESEMIFIGLVGMIDPPRPEVKVAIQTCVKAGIKAVMITGDHPITAEAIARELGLLRDGKVIIGAHLEKMSDEEFEKNIENIDVYARVSPAHKLRIVTTFQKKGHIVAMTGDGVNDAPALKKANIGIAMGITGTDVSKEAAAMMLLDDNFASIVAAVEEGRGIFGNIKKYLMYLLSSNIGEIGLMTMASVLGLPLPLTAVQILYVNLATDGLPALALAVDPPEKDLMQRPPRDNKVGIFTRPVVALMLVGGIWSTIINISLFAWARSTDHTVTEAMTMTFVSLVLIQFIKAYNFRSDRNSVLDKPFANKWLNISILWELFLIVLIVYLPALHKPFSTFSLTLMDWIIVVVLAFTVLPVLEFAKYIERKGYFGKLV